MTSRNICQISDDNGSILYRAICSCVGNDCGHILALEYDSGVGAVILTIYADIHYTEYFCQGWWQTLLRRLRTAWSIIVHARQDELCCEYVFGGKEHIRAYIQALEEGLAKVA